MKLTAGSTIGSRQLTTVPGGPAWLPDQAGLVHLQFRRFAGCPVCNLHLRSFASRHGELAAAGVCEVVVFHSTAADLAPHTAALPFAVVADPEKKLYREFGVESAKRALLDPRAWPVMLVGVLYSLWDAARRAHPATVRTAGGRFGLPADFLIAPSGRVLAAKYGEHAGDHWSVSDVISLVREQHQSAPAPATRR